MTVIHHNNTTASPPPTHEGAQDEVCEKVVAEFDHAEGDPVVAERDWGESLGIVGEGKVTELRLIITHRPGYEHDSRSQQKFGGEEVPQSQHRHGRTTASLSSLAPPALPPPLSLQAGGEGATVPLGSSCHQGMELLPPGKVDMEEGK